MNGNYIRGINQYLPIISLYQSLVLLLEAERKAAKASNKMARYTFILALATIFFGYCYF